MTTLMNGVQGQSMHTIPMRGKQLKKLRRDREKMLVQPGQVLPPMPPEEDVLRRFDVVLRKMDLPTDKARILRGYPLDKKWEMVCDDQKFTSQEPPQHYIDRLSTFLCDNSKSGNKKRQKKLLGQETSTTMLKHLETSLRTNSIDWVREFLSAEHDGLRVLVEFLQLIQDDGLQPPPDVSPSTSRTDTIDSSHSSETTTTQTNGGSIDYSSMSLGRRLLTKGQSTDRSKGSMTKRQGQPEDDIHVCLQCLRAIMNNKQGFDSVFCYPDAIYCIVRSILHGNLKTKALVLELLAALCLVKGGHALITAMFDRFRREHGEERRWQSLLHFLRHPPTFHVAFMVACMQFVNIIVHSVDDLNYRVFLQYEFHSLGLHELLDIYKESETELLQLQATAYLDNTYDVAQLYDDADKRGDAEVRAKCAEDTAHALNERLQEVEADYMARLYELDTKLSATNDECSRYRELTSLTGSEVTTLRARLDERDKMARSEQTKLYEQIAQLEKDQLSLKEGLLNTQTQTSVQSSKPATPISPSVVASITSPPIPPPPGPPPPPIAMLSSTAPPPPPPPMAGLLTSGIPANDMGTIKRKHVTKCKLPMFNWTPLKCNQVKETVFHELDDDKLVDTIDFTQLEDLFRMGESKAMSTSMHISPEHSAVGTSKAAILDTKRLQNVGITRRKLAIDAQTVMMAVHKLNLVVLPTDKVDILQRIMPGSDETKAFAEYERENRSMDALTEEERFVAQLCKIERLPHKLQIMTFMGSFDESAALLQPQLTKLTAASKAVQDASKFHHVLEIVLAFGNYMNSARRGGAFGFKLQSLESLTFQKSPADRSISLMHVLAATVRRDFPHLVDFGEQMKFAEQAAHISLESMATDMAELERGFAAAQNERQLKGGECPTALTQFLDAHDGEVEKLRANFKMAEESFGKCVQFYGENAKSASPSTFFAILANFSRNFNSATEDNLKRHKQLQREKADLARRQARDAAAAVAAQSVKKSTEDPQAAVANQLNVLLSAGGAPNAARRRQRSTSRDKQATTRIRDRGDLAEGALDDIINSMREEPYMVFDGGQARRRKQSSSSSAATNAAASQGRNRPVKPPPPMPKPQLPAR